MRSEQRVPILFHLEVDVPGARFIKSRHDRAEREQTTFLCDSRAVKLESHIAARGVRVVGVIIYPIRVHLPDLDRVVSQRLAARVHQASV